MAIKAVAVIEGKDVEVELKEIPKGFLTQEQHGILLGEEMERRIPAAKRNARTELLEDKDFYSEFSTKHGLVKKGDGGNGEPSPERAEQMFGQWSKQHLEPLKGQLTEAQKNGETFMTATLESQILAEMPSLKKQYRTPPSEGAKAMIVTLLAPLFGWDAKSNMFALKKGDSFEFSSKPTTGKPYKGIEEYVAEMQKNATFADWFDKKTQDSPNVGDTEVTDDGTPNKPPTQWTSEERANYINTHGQPAYRKLLDEEVRLSAQPKKK